MNQGNKFIGSYFGKEIVLYSPLLKWYLQEGLIITKFHCAIKYQPENAFKKLQMKYQMQVVLEMLINLMN